MSGAHGDDVGQVCGCRPTSDVVRGRPITPEVAILDEEIGGGDHPAVSCAQDGSVVAGTEDHRVAAGQQFSATAAISPNSPSSPMLPEAVSMMRPSFSHRHRQQAHSRHGSRYRVASPLAEPQGRRTNVVVQAYILIQTEVGKAASVAREIANIKGVTLAEDVTGPYDVIVRAEARNMDELGKLVVAKVQGVDGITRTLTCPVVHL